MNVKVSVCVVTYNHENYIRECLDSIFSQEANFEYEVIVGDDASTDATLSVLLEYQEKYRDKLRIISHQKNIGPTKNYISVHSIAKGEYVCHVDGDDKWLPNKLIKQVEFLDANSEYSVVWGKCNYFDDNGGFLSAADYDHPLCTNTDGAIITLKDAVHYGSIAVHSTIMYVRDKFCLNDVDGSKEYLDVYFTFRLLEKGKGKILGNVVAEYRVESEHSITFSKTNKLKELYLIHLNEMSARKSAEKKDFFIGSFWQFVIDVKNMRKTSLGFFKIMMKNICYVKLKELHEAYLIIRKLKRARVTNEQ